MVAYKIYKSGDNYEIYKYEYMNLPEKGDEPEEEEEDWYTEIDEDRKEERRMQTLRENAMNLKRMAREHFRGKIFFMTLTFAENLQDIDKADRKVKYMFKKFRENYGETSFIGVREKQQRGAIHYHFLVKNEKLREYYDTYVPGAKKVRNRTVTSEEQKTFERFFQQKYWKHGFINLTMIDFVDDVGAYLAKYLSKGKLEEMKWLEKRRLVLRSTDIKKIAPLDEVEDAGLFKALVEQVEYLESIAKEDIENNVKRKRVFTNGYKSKYMGNILYMDVHLNRIADKENE